MHRDHSPTTPLWWRLWLLSLRWWMPYIWMPVLDHPEFFWEDDTWLPLYLRAAKYLEIERRTEVPPPAST